MCGVGKFRDAWNNPGIPENAICLDSLAAALTSANADAVIKW